MLIVIIFHLCFHIYSARILQGKFTSHIIDYELVLPRKVKSNGAFHSFKLPHFYSYSNRREGDEEINEVVFYKVPINNYHYTLKMFPNRRFVSPNMVIESQHKGNNISGISLVKPTKHLCHYSGNIVGDPSSSAALSLCDGIVGHIKTNDSVYFIEPIKNEDASKTGEHVHVLYKRTLGINNNRCYSSRDDWWNSWAEELYTSKVKSLRDGKCLKNTRRELSEIDQSPKYLEVCLVPDARFLQYHQDKNVEEYLLTLMNMVSDLWHDASIGHEINIVVVRIIYLLKEMEEFDLNIMSNPEDVLHNFCKWQSPLNPPDDNHPYHNDLAILFSRLDLTASEKGNSSPQGIAYEASACSQIGKNCAVIVDTGLVTGVCTAHEIGHTMGCAHDTPEIGCSGPLTDGTMTIMSPTISATSHAWSDCSKDFVSNFFRSGLGDCMMDQPKGHNYQSIESLPGTLYDFDAQCRMLFGYDYMGCPMGGDDVCKVLWCKRTTRQSCISKGEPVADGTVCGSNKWCYHGECIEEGLRPGAIDGNWGEWGSWVECSRTCGGGVESRKRACIDPAPENGGKYCIGPEVQYSLCNLEPCPQDLPRFREVQCSAFNSIPFRGETHFWSPVPPPDSDPNPCALYCINEKQVTAKLQTRVLDGTRCRAGSKDTCIQGSCVPVGCDWKIGSDAIEDICGECGGDGTHCGMFKFVFKEPGNIKVCEKLTLIPRNSKNVGIKLLGETKNKLAVGDSDETIYFTDEMGDVPPGEYVFGGAHGIYTKPEKNRQEIHIKGPLREDTSLWLCFKEPENPGVQVIYTLPTYTSTHVPEYHWEFIEWGPCSARCGTGTQISKPSCVEEKGGKVMDEFCRNLPDKPEPKSRVCNVQKCKARWKAWNWGPCSGCLYKTGRRTRRVECVMESPKFGDGDEIILNEAECSGPAPKKFELCNSVSPCISTQVSRSKAIRHQALKEMGYYNYCYDKEGLDVLPASSYQRPVVKKVTGRLFPGRVIKDTIDTKDMSLIVAKLVVSKNNLNLTEEYFEEEGDHIPSYVPGDIREYHGKEALKKITELFQEETTEKRTVHLNASCTSTNVKKKNFMNILSAPLMDLNLTSSTGCLSKGLKSEHDLKMTTPKSLLTNM